MQYILIWSWHAAVGCWCCWLPHVVHGRVRAMVASHPFAEMLRQIVGVTEDVANHNPLSSLASLDEHQDATNRLGLPSQAIRISLVPYFLSLCQFLNFWKGQVRSSLHF